MYIIKFFESKDKKGRYFYASKTFFFFRQAQPNTTQEKWLSYKSVQNCYFSSFILVIITIKK